MNQFSDYFINNTTYFDVLIYVVIPSNINKKQQ